MPTAKQTVAFEGMESLLGVIRDLPDEVQLTVLVPVVRAGGKVVKEGAKFLAPVDEGDLRDSIDQVERSYKATNSAVSVVGPRSDFRRGKKRPSKIASQVEFGHVTRKAAKGRRSKPGKLEFVPGKPYMRPAVETAATFAIEPMYGAAVTGLDRAADKLVRKYGHQRS